MATVTLWFGVDQDIWKAEPPQQWTDKHLPLRKHSQSTCPSTFASFMFISPELILNHSCWGLSF